MDLPYEEDSRAEVDLNVVMQEGGDFVEIQGTGEHGLFGRADSMTCWTWRRLVAPSLSTLKRRPSDGKAPRRFE
ncbi:hypothetical protein [Corynebacterium guaraldiae]|uniref:hypothetical protein n=1 Tax=Corynebacterium guaraldiae TaxID=3051103 RepID=UPI00259D2392|nr:hypothetical protein [Corynebacterium guaraldiae]